MRSAGTNAQKINIQKESVAVLDSSVIVLRHLTRAVAWDRMHTTNQASGITSGKLGTNCQVPLMDMGFAVSCPLARHCLPPIQFLSIGSRVRSTLLSDPASRRRRCASLSLHVHHVVKRTFTSRLLGTQHQRPASVSCADGACTRLGQLKLGDRQQFGPGMTSVRIRVRI
jgi:hypothetical protein